MNPSLFTLVAPLALTAAAAQASPAVRNFELPPGPSTSPTAEAPQVQGPVDPDAPVATRPRPVDRPAAPPTTAPAPLPTPAIPPTATPSPTATASARPPRPLPTTEPGDAPAPSVTQTAPPPPIAGEEALPPAASTLPQTDATSTPASEPEHGTVSTVAALVAGLVVLLAALAAGLWWWRRRQPTTTKVPQIELPLVTPQADPAPVSPPASLPSPAFGPLLRIDATPSHLTRSLMAATFSCRIALENRGEQPLADLAVGLDLTTAHGSVAAGDQLADPDRPLPEVLRVARLEPGERVEFARDVRLPTAEIRALRQGEARLYIPLLRVRAQAGGDRAVARTFIVGTLPDAGATKLQPFRLDEIPQTYRMIGVAALD